MRFKGLIGLFAAGLLLGIGVSAAQDTTAPEAESTPQADALPLRELAARSNLYIGAAVHTTHLDNPEFVETLAREFNMITPENEAKACEVQPELGRFDFTKVDKMVDFAEAHNMKVHGHTLVWHECVPVWVVNGGYTRDEAIALLRDQIHAEVGRYKGRVMDWDVVSEAIAEDGSGLRNTPWRRLIGDDYIELAFRFAHEADPDALLFYNDLSAEGINAKSNAVYAMVQDLVARGVPIHGVGLQSHFALRTINTPGIARNIQRLGELGLQVQITEVDVRYQGATTPAILQLQAGDFAKLLATCLDSPYCTAFTTWGVSDRYSWLRRRDLGFFDNPTVAPLLFDDDFQPKPAYFAVRDVLAQGRPSS